MKREQPPDLPAALSEVPEENRAAAIRLGRVMKQLHRRISSNVMQEMQAELTELDLSFSQMTALHYLRAAGAASVTSISEGTRLSLPATSHLVERLVQRGLAGREENPENRREKLVSLTEKGLGVLGGMDSSFVAGYVTTFAALSPGVMRDATQTLEALLDELSSVSPCTFNLSEKP